MTFVITNGLYMIADKRRTGMTHEPNRKFSENPEFNKNRTHRTRYDDNVDKLIPLPKGVSYDGKKVLCISGSGTVEALDAFYKIMHAINVREYLKALTGTKGNFNANYSLLMMLEDHSSVRVTLKNTERMITTSTTVLAKGVVNSIGSGGLLYGILNKEFGIQNKDSELLDIFFFGVNSTAGCSFNYDVYGAVENEYHRNLKPSREAVQESAKKTVNATNWFQDKSYFSE